MDYSQCLDITDAWIRLQDTLLRTMAAQAITYRQLAKEMDVTINQVYAIVRKNSNPSLRQMVLVEKWLEKWS